MSKLWGVFILSGLAMLVSAVLLCVHNFNESNIAQENAQTALTGLKSLIPDIPEVPEDPKQAYLDHIYEIQENAKRDLLAESESRLKENEEKEPEMKSIELDGRYYCGYITLNTIGLELPILNDWSYANLNIAPCRYEGTPETHNFIIAAHNYNSHFGTLKNLREDDEIIFTDCNGKKYHYFVTYMEYIDGYSVDKMTENNSTWDLTLFTCTLNGQSRVTIRAKLEE